MCIGLSKLIELGNRIGTTNAKAVNRIIDAQDYALQRQRVKADSSRKKAEPVYAQPELYR